MSQYVTDTHALYWHLIESPKLSSTVQNIFQKTDIGNNQILIPSIILIELIYLEEKNRIDTSSVNKVLELLDIVNSSYDVVPLSKNTAKALQKVPREDIPDMPDRIITATAYQLNLPLITKDNKIQNSKVVNVIW